MQSVLCGAGWRFLAVSTTLAVACDQSGSRDVNDARTQRSARPCRPARTATELTNAVGKGIGNALRIWNGHAHDWPIWEKMIRLYIGGHD